MQREGRDNAPWRRLGGRGQAALIGCFLSYEHGPCKDNQWLTPSGVNAKQRSEAEDRVALEPEGLFPAGAVNALDFGSRLSPLLHRSIFVIFLCS